MDENPTKKKIIMLLKKSEHMTVTELSREMGLTPMAVRQHLMSLEKRGVISYAARKYGIGRPVFLYRLTEKANDIFPKSYGTFVREMLGALERVDGRKKLDRLFLARKEDMLEERKRQFKGLTSLAERLSTLSSLMDKEGLMVEVTEAKDAYKIKQYNCLIYGVARDYPEACKYEIELYAELLGREVKLLECQRDGFPACLFSIRKR